jgi:flagellar biosynthesis protein FliR
VTPDPLVWASPASWQGVGLLAARTGAVLATAPFFGVAALPARIRTALALLLAIVLFPVVGSAIVPADLPGLGIMLLQEVLVGSVIGLGIGLFFYGATVAGEVAGVQMGLGAAVALDPNSEVSSPVVANFLLFFALAAWFAIDGHLHMIYAIATSYEIIPVGTSLSAGGLVFFARAAAMVFEAAINICAPILVAMLMANVAMAVLARTAPQMNVYIASFPVTMTLGLLVMAITLPALSALVGQWAGGTQNTVGKLLEALAAPR